MMSKPRKQTGNTIQSQQAYCIALHWLFHYYPCYKSDVKSCLKLKILMNILYMIRMYVGFCHYMTGLWEKEGGDVT